MSTTTTHGRTHGTIAKRSLSDAERDRLHGAYQHVNFPHGPRGDHDKFVAVALRWFLRFAPLWLIEEIIRWHSDRSGPGVLVIDNLGVEATLPPTPIDGRRSPDKVTSLSEMVLVAVGTMLGQVFSFTHERNGDLVTDLTPVQGKESALTNEGAAGLGWHTEHAATGLLLGPTVNIVDYLAFLGLRPDHARISKTVVADIRDALPLLGRETIDALRAPIYRLRPPLLVRQKLPVERQSIDRVPVLTGPEMCPEVRVALYGDMTEGMTPEADRALVDLSVALDAVQRGLATVSGRLALVDNRTVLHGRAPFTPRFDGNDRWLMRAMVTSSLRPMQAWQRDSTRVLTPMP